MSASAHAEERSHENPGARESRQRIEQAPDFGRLVEKLAGLPDDHEGVALSAGIAQSVETMRFGKDTHFYCGIAGFFGGRTFASPGCATPAKFAGPKLSVNLGVGVSIGVGLDGTKMEKHLPALIIGVRDFVKASGTKGLAKALADAVTPVVAKHPALGKSANVVTLLVGRFIAAFDRGATKDLLAELPDAAKDLATLFEQNPRIDWNGVLVDTVTELEKTQPALATALGHLTAMVSGCDVVGVGVTSPLPGLAFSYISDLGDGMKAALVAAGGPPAQALACWAPALEQACRLGAALNRAGVAVLPGVSAKACDEAKRAREQLQKGIDPIAALSLPLAAIHEQKERERAELEQARKVWNDADGKSFAEREACAQWGLSLSESERGRQRFCNAQRTGFNQNAADFCAKKCGYENFKDPGCSRGCGNTLHDFCVGRFSCKN